MRFYVTKWVIARGILCVEGSAPAKLHHRMLYLHTSVDIPGWRSSYPLKVGAEAFLTLKEAEEDAMERFARHVKKVRQEYAYAVRATRLIELGKGPVVHRNIQAVNKCHAFTPSKL